MRLALVAALVACPVVAQEAEPPGPPPESSLTPKLRPEGLSKGPTESAEAEEPGAEATDQPDNQVTAIDAAPVVPDQIAYDAEALAACYGALNALGVSYQPIDPISAEDRACGIRQPVEVSMLPGEVTLEPTARMRCETALALATWVQDFAIPASRVLPERGRLSAIEHGSAYVCRRRNNDPDGKVSEHAYGNAIDIMGFRFEEGPPIPVMPREREGTMAEAFQDAARATACLHFSTVLGPGSDAAHDNHLHLDVRARRGGFRLCQ